MRIAQLVSNEYAVNPHSGMGIYSQAAWLTNGLVSRGNDVTLFGSGDSVTNATLQAVSPIATREAGLAEDLRKQYLHVLISKCYEKASEFDIIHSHFSLLSSYYSGLVKTPTLQSVHSPLDEHIKKVLHFFPKNYYVSFSLAQRKQMPELNWAANIYHGIDTSLFSFNPHPEDYFFYIGRITDEKGVHLAIEAAITAGVNLIIAGNSYPDEKYWQSKIEPFINGKTIKFIGHVGVTEKVKYLQNAKGLLFPTQYDEVFGLVMIEAMSCGTPVIGWNKGSVPEVVQHKESGYVVNSVGEMVRAIKSIDKISREATRKRALKYFSVEKMVTGYEKVYLKIIEHNRQKQIANKNPKK